LQGALERYDALASSSEPYAEHALFAAARLRAKLGEKDGALEAFRSYRRRYPDGAYASVVSVHVLDLLLQRGDDREVLGEADAFLAAHPSDPRAWRFRMARGAIAIKNGDCAAALRDLASVPDAQAIPLRRRCAAPSPSSR
jgi:TolA-binding protein